MSNLRLASVTAILATAGLVTALYVSAESVQSSSQQTSKSQNLSKGNTTPYNGEDATTPYVAHLDARTGKVLDVAPEGPSVPQEQCVKDQMEKDPEPAIHGVATLHVCHPNSAPALVVEQRQKSEPDRTWRDNKPETLGGRRSITI